VKKAGREKVRRRELNTKKGKPTAEAKTKTENRKPTSDMQIGTFIFPGLDQMDSPDHSKYSPGFQALGSISWLNLPNRFMMQLVWFLLRHSV
jgi:hypothetical protein